MRKCYVGCTSMNQGEAHSVESPLSNAPDDLYFDLKQKLLILQQETISNLAVLHESRTDLEDPAQILILTINTVCLRKILHRTDWERIHGSISLFAYL